MIMKFKKIYIEITNKCNLNCSFCSKDKRELKSISTVIDKDIVLNKELLQLGKKMQEMTLATLISCYQVMLPKALKAKHGTIISKKYDIYYKLKNSFDKKLNSKQQEIIYLLEKNKLVKN